MTKILGIDPGTGRVGFGILEKNSTIQILDYGVIQTPQKEKRWERLSMIHSEVSRIIKRHSPDILAVEKIFFNKNIKTALAVSEAVGVILLAAHRLLIPIREYTPLEVKETLVGSGRAKKQEVKGMLELLLNQKLKGPDDAADAIAVAYCHLCVEGLGL